MSSILRYQALALQLYLLQDEAWLLTKEVHSKRMDFQGQAPAKPLIIQFHLHVSINKQCLEDLKILHISSAYSNYTNIAIPS